MVVRAIGESKMKSIVFARDVLSRGANARCYFHRHNSGNYRWHPEIVRRGRAAWHFGKNGKISCVWTAKSDDK